MGETADPASHTVEHGKLPDAPLLDVRQVVNWIAFGYAVDRDLTGGSELKWEWFSEPVPPGDTSGVLVALRMLASGQTEWPEDAILGLYPSERLVAKELEKARLLMARWGLPAATLADGLQRMLGGHRFRLERVTAAITELEDALKRGKLHSMPFREDGSPKAPLPRQRCRRNSSAPLPFRSGPTASSPYQQGMATTMSSSARRGCGRPMWSGSGHLLGIFRQRRAPGSRRRSQGL
jgi:hypothetical protein